MGDSTPAEFMARCARSKYRLDYKIYSKIATPTLLRTLKFKIRKLDSLEYTYANQLKARQMRAENSSHDLRRWQ